MDVEEYNKDKKEQKLFSLDLEKTKEGKEKLVLEFESSNKLSKSGKNILCFYDKSQIKGKTIQITIYEKKN